LAELLTTAGFGDIVPVLPVARGLTMLKQVVGVLYVAILIARLSKMYPTEEYGQ
jgi:Na+/citrate or Na+/malate symporter